MNFKNSPQTQQRASPYLSRQSSKSSSRSAKTQRNVEPPSPLPVGCCRGFTNVKTTTGSTASTSQQQHQQHEKRYQRLQVKVADLEKEVQKQTELRVMYRKRMERTQDYLRYCLQIAQENGILDLIVHCKGELQQSPLYAHSINGSPKILTPAHHHPSLAAITDQAKTNGWYIDPIEVSST